MVESSWKVQEGKGQDNQVSAKVMKIGEENLEGLTQSKNPMNLIPSNLTDHQPQPSITLHSTHFPTISSDITQAISEGIVRLKHAPVDLYNTDKCLVEIKGKGNMEMIWDKSEKGLGQRGLSNLKSAQKNVRLSQVQLFQYLLYQYNQQKQSKITLDIRDYFGLRGIVRRKENIDRFYQDLTILSWVSIDLTGKNSGHSEPMIGKLLTVKGLLSAGEEEIGFKGKGEKVAKVVVELGEWIQKLKLTQFILLPIAFFEYTAPNQSPAILMSLKFNQLCRVNSGKGLGYNKKVTVKSLLGTLGVTKKDVAKQGGQYYQTLLERCFKLLEDEGYCIVFKKAEAGIAMGFLENIVLYRNDGLESLYCIRKIRTHTDKK